MTGWWQERATKLWWKELRESYAVLVLGWIITLATLAKLPSSTSRYVWGIDFHNTAMAILFFVALVLGVTAYAVEEEYETLEPLMAKPIPPNDILATKLGVRLGLLFFSAIVVGIIELLTGAWPVEFSIPSRIVFERWLGGLMLLVFGLGLGLYFGKILGRQITGLLSAILVFAAGWVLLELSPLSFLFEGESGQKIYWIKIILLPGLAGTITILASIRARPGAVGLLARPAVAAIALAGYALIFWSLTIVPPGDAWQNGQLYRLHWTVRFAGPEAGLDALVDRFIHQKAGNIRDDPDSISVVMILHTNISPSGLTYPTERIGDSNLLGLRGRVVRTYRRRDTISPHTDIEILAAEYRSERWIARCLDIARQPGYSEHHKLIALHLAGRASHAEHTESIASFLDTPSLNVRLMAAYMLAAREDQRGEEVLKAILPRIESMELIKKIAYLTSSIGIDTGPEFATLMRRWIVSEGPYDRRLRSAARYWYRKNGSMEDVDLIRRSLWLDRWPPLKEATTPEDIPVWDYMKEWNAPGFIDELHRQATRTISKLRDVYQEAHIILLKNYQLRTADEKLKVRRYNTLTSSLYRIIRELAEQLDPGFIELWEEYRQLRYYDDRYLFAVPLITYLPWMGEPGIQELRSVVENTKVRIYTRFQAALLLAYHGYREFDGVALRFFELYRETDRFDGYFRRGDPWSAFLAMVEKGNLIYAGPIIETAWNVFENRGRVRFRSIMGYRYVRTGTSIWNNITAQVLEEATGKKYGWNLKAWKAWWDREGKNISSGNN